MKPGDLLHIHGQNDDGTFSEWYAEVVGVDDNDNVEVFYLEQTQLCNGHVWSFKKEWDVIPKESIKAIFSPCQKTYLATYKEFGFIPTVEENQFLRVNDNIPSHVLTPLPLDEDNDEHDDDSDMADFIVDDDIADEPFTHADVNTSDFVKETHQAVNDYNQWAPATPEELRVKNFIDGLAKRYQEDDDNRQFARGTSVNYERPKIK